jgi:hypothetical protein
MEPKKKLTAESRFIAPNVFASYSDQRILVESTGHRKVNGKWIGDDPFYSFRYEENPGLGEMLNLPFNKFYKPWGSVLEGTSHSWRPCLSRYFSTADDQGSPFRSSGIPDFHYDPLEDWTLLLNDLGTKFIQRARPGNPTASLAQFVAELHDIPRIPRYLKVRLASFLKHLPSEYLNVEFGWKPFLEDLWKAYKTSTTLEARLAQLVRDNGLHIKRKRRLLGEEEPQKDTLFDDDLPLNTVEWIRFGIDGPNSSDDPPDDLLDFNSFRLSDPVGIEMNSNDFHMALTQKHFKLERETQVFARGTGTFTYYVPDIGSSEWTRKAINVLFGANPNPLVLWQVLPWSWLVGWWTNADSILSNAMSNAVDNEVYENCSVTYEKRVTHTATLDIAWDPFYMNLGGFGFQEDHIVLMPSGRDSLKWSCFEHYKLRRPATPFGFGIDMSGLTAAQYAILAALGLSRRR